MAASAPSAVRGGSSVPSLGACLRLWRGGDPTAAPCCGQNDAVNVLLHCCMSASLGTSAASICSVQVQCSTQALQAKVQYSLCSYLLDRCAAHLAVCFLLPAQRCLNRLQGCLECSLRFWILMCQRLHSQSVNQAKVAQQLSWCMGCPAQLMAGRCHGSCRPAN